MTAESDHADMIRDGRLIVQAAYNKGYEEGYKDGAARCDALENALREIRDYRLGGNPDADVIALNKIARAALAATEKKSSEEESE